MLRAAACIPETWGGICGSTTRPCLFGSMRWYRWQPASAAAGWFAGAGRCGLLEPVGTHPDHRGHGYGRDAVLGACAALADRGASAVAVVTPSTNEAAVALYRSAGFTVVRENRDRVRPRRT